MVGEVDKNVYLASAMKVCDALIKANKDYMFLVLLAASD
jgi:dipeptidyl aminopeptidase/acylaminoacyl peptidase